MMIDHTNAVRRIAQATATRLEQDFHGSPVLFIANAIAGTRRRRDELARIASSVVETGVVRLAWTRTPEEVVRVIDAFLSDHPGQRCIVISMGGDGTHKHVLQAGRASGAVDRLCFLRLPMGSGNDASDIIDLPSFLGGHALEEHWIPAVDIEGNGFSDTAFNIVSVGLDAYVAWLHERWRSRLPGNTYRLLVDLAVVRYERAVRLQPMGIQLRSAESGEPARFLSPEMRSIVVFGATGNRTYGDHMRVLPDQNNVCVVRRIGVLKKMQLKKLFYNGDHISEDPVSMHTATSMELSYSGRLPYQADGETRWIDAANFPVTTKVAKRAVRILRPAAVGYGTSNS